MEWLPSEEAAILVAMLVACGFLVLGILELLWPSDPPRPAQRREPVAAPPPPEPPGADAERRRAVAAAREVLWIRYQRIGLARLDAEVPWGAPALSGAARALTAPRRPPEASAAGDGGPADRSRRDG